jgi:hypothetical protein
MQNNELPKHGLKSKASLPDDRRYVIYRWLSSGDFLVHKIVPAATIIDARVNDRVEEILARIPRDTRCFHFHLNCTVTRRFPVARDDLIEQLLARDILPINERLTDISKRAIQRKCRELGLHTTAATSEGAADELIIVKTDLNFGGDSEWALSAAERSMLGIGAASNIMWRPDDYRVIPRSEVEASWWTDPSLVCEKYIANRDNRWYRALLFFSRLVLRELVNETTIKKVGQSSTVGQWDIDMLDRGRTSPASDYPQSLVDDLILFIRGFGMDFGAIDIVINDEGQAFIIDVNSTPAMHVSPVPGLANLREGLSVPR